MLQNLVQGELVNGSVGRIVAFRTAKEAVQDNTEIGQTEEKATAAPPRVERQWPVVLFTMGKEVLITPQDFTINNAQGEVEARREQVLLC